MKLILKENDTLVKSRSFIAVTVSWKQVLPSCSFGGDAHGAKIMKQGLIRGLHWIHADASDPRTSQRSRTFIHNIHKRPFLCQNLQEVKLSKSRIIHFDQIRCTQSLQPFDHNTDLEHRESQLLLDLHRFESGLCP